MVEKFEELLVSAGVLCLILFHIQVVVDSPDRFARLIPLSLRWAGRQSGPVPEKWFWRAGRNHCAPGPVALNLHSCNQAREMFSTFLSVNSGRMRTMQQGSARVHSPVILARGGCARCHWIQRASIPVWWSLWVDAHTATRFSARPFPCHWPCDSCSGWMRTLPLDSARVHSRVILAWGEF